MSRLHLSFHNKLRYPQRSEGLFIIGVADRNHFFDAPRVATDWCEEVAIIFQFVAFIGYESVKSSCRNVNVFHPKVDFFLHFRIVVIFLNWDIPSRLHNL